SAGITNGAGSPPGDRDGVMAGQLKAPQDQQGHQVAQVQTVGARIESTVKGNGPRAQAPGQLSGVRAILDQAAPEQFLIQIHRVDRLTRSIPECHPNPRVQLPAACTEGVWV